MSDQANMPAPPTDERSPPRRGIRTAWVVALVLAAGLTGAAATTAFSRGMGFGPGHWHGGFMSRPFDPAQAEERADRMVRHLAIELDASSEQQDKLRAVVRSAVKDIMPMRETVQQARTQARKLLTDPTINRAEIERLRAEQIALADTFSKRIAQALGDAGEILTAEQRRKLDEHLPRAGAMGPMGGSGRGWNRW
jgi:Spy/CpxP family protein refolding chaperone